MTAGDTQRPARRIAFVSDELLGYAGNGIGTTTTFVSLALARMGHRVEILFAGQAPSGPIDSEWQRLYDEAGIRVRVVPKGSQEVRPGHFARMLDVEVALRADPADVVVVQDLGAPAYTAIRLRRLGLGFEQTSFVVFCHGTRQWITDVSRKVRVLPGAHAVSALERASIELADAVVSPSRYLVEWMRGEGWHLPEHTFVIPHVSRATATGEQPRARTAQKSARIDRVAFFGRLEERKGVRPFIGALNALTPELLERFELEFIGRPTPAWPVERVEHLLSERARAALRGLSFETALDQHEALARLSRAGTLAVMPSFEENSPNTVYECLERQIPFIASDAAGIRELVAEEDHARVLFAPTQDGIAKALTGALTDAASVGPAHPAYDDGESLRRWDRVLALSGRPLPPEGPSVSAVGPGWVLLLEEEDVPDPELVEALVRAQQVSGADVVSCGLFVDGTVHLFPGEPRALGLLVNGYGTVCLVRESLLERADEESRWPLLAELSASGAKIVSVPVPLVTTATSPADLHTDPAEALRVLTHLERALPQNLRLVAELTTRLAADTQRPPPAPRTRSVRRAVRRFVRGRRR
jgi:glycosyltransferase involved in cell wall biosynthesis